MHVIHYLNGKRITQSYPRYIMEKILDRKLLPEEEVDHKDNNYTNNSIFNYQIITKLNNIQKEYIRSGRTQKMSEHICPECNTLFFKKENIIKHNLKQGKAGPFCSRSCAGKYNQRKL